MIPKVIHFCWFGNAEHPPLMQACIETWHQYLPDWEFKLWNEDNSPMDHPFVKKAMQEKQYAFVADYVRCHALYHEGGIYLDTDMELVKPLDVFLNQKFFSGYEDKDNQVVSCGIIGAVARHSILKAMLNYYDECSYLMTIPFIMTTVINNKDIIHDEYKLYNREYFYPYHIIESYPITQLMYKDVTEQTYAIHHWKKSWTIDSGSLLVRGYRYILRKFGKY